MSSKKKLYLLCYDVREPKRLRKCRILMKSYGKPVQYSVFQSYLNDTQMGKLRWELSKLLQDEDSLLIAPIHDPDVNRIVQWNVKNVIQERDDRFEIF